ncbi:AMP-binding protein [Salinisphaera sp. Q1T1-3]|uniref:AMP-binding protein n=1 Tax=Salinisphaera sp. Q1T1-3 TaxID=2321229 RepID=UPI000E73191C|nr:AMP-binding protein [Salinisphaera sp. Q1T1-3]RJS91079.1 acyl-CoA synthetase [Salinisphaera sp. Q1T1-3]
MSWHTPDPIALHARGQPNRLAARDIATDRHWTYAELDRDIQRAVTLLQHDYDIRPGDRLAVVSGNCVDQILLALALERLGAIFVPLNHRLAPAELGVILDDCRPRLLVTDRRETLSASGADCPMVDMGDVAAGIAASEPAGPLPVQPASAVKILLYTSGTSGRPKGVMITGQNIHATAVNFGVLGRVTYDSVFLCDAPMFHVIGLLPSVRSPLLFGGTLHISPGFDPTRTNAMLADETIGVTHYFCVPKMADMLAEQSNFAPDQWHRLKALFTGGSPISPQRIRRWLAHGVCISNGFGMTEAGTLLHVPLDREVIDATAGSVGLAPPEIAIRLVDETERDVPPGTAGEILARGPNITPGYWQRPAETAAAFTADGWLRTGDIGQADDNGFITLRDRKKDMYISGGENVFPAEVEHILSDHADVIEAAVIGVADDDWGEVGHAYVVLGDDARADAEALARHCRDHLAGYKMPRRFFIVDALPRNAAGKLMKQQLGND